MRFSTVVEGALWDEDEQFWTVTMAGGERLQTRFLLAATGFLSQPRKPEIEGIESFAGTVLHTADWVTPQQDARVPGPIRRMYAKIPLTQRVVRTIGSGILEAIMVSGDPGQAHA